MVRLVDARAEKVADGKIVAVSIVAQPGRHQVPLGEISAVLGDPDDPEIQYKIVCHNSQIPMDFPQEVLREAHAAVDPYDVEFII
ncbi:hypothetical protein MYX64_13095, partial [Nitrospinae bacterium AH_259_B05_G02_I21]|nr:hypothetical protein [Nitrospinae bacterium AH_259_B05_G02_I21]